jgi:hypothetical protein
VIEAEAPDFAEPLEAWRVWRVLRTDGRLTLASVVHSTPWPVGRELTAECLRSPRLWSRLRHTTSHSAPEPLCDCGIYGTTLERAGEYLGIDVPARRRGVRVLGVVSLWGSVVDCERGYRASRAYPTRIYVPADAASGSARGADDVARDLTRYRVPIELLTFSSAEAMDALTERRAA